MPITVDTKELLNVSKKIATLGEIAQASFKRFADSGKVQEEYKKILKANLDSQGSASGSAWKKNAESTIERKKKKNQSTKVLEARGDTREELLNNKNSIDVKLNNSLQIEAKVTGEPGRIYGHHVAGKGRLPERNIGRLPEKTGSRFVESYSNEIDKEIKAVFRK